MKDPLCTFEDAKELARRCQTYYHVKGYKRVHFWVEPDKVERGGKVMRIYPIKSNIKYLHWDKAIVAS